MTSLSDPPGDDIPFNHCRLVAAFWTQLGGDIFSQVVRPLPICRSTIHDHISIVNHTDPHHVRPSARDTFPQPPKAREVDAGRGPPPSRRAGQGIQGSRAKRQRTHGDGEAEEGVRARQSGTRSEGSSGQGEENTGSSSMEAICAEAPHASPLYRVGSNSRRAANSSFARAEYQAVHPRPIDVTAVHLRRDASYPQRGRPG